MYLIDIFTFELMAELKNTVVAIFGETN